MIHYILIRRDLPFGVALAQTAHAAAYSMAGWVGRESYVEMGGYVMGPDWEPMTVVVLGVKDRQALKRWEKKLNKLSRKPPYPDYYVVREPDAPWNNQEMAIGIFPGLRSELEPLFKKLSTYQVYEGPLTRLEDVR